MSKGSVRRWTATVLLAATACLHAAEPAAPGSREPSVTIEGAAVHYVGLMTDTGFDALEAILDAASVSPEMFVVDSAGGSPFPAMRIGSLVHERGMHVVATGRGCNSACANYVFTPAMRKTIRSGSKVVWHNSCPGNVPSGTNFLEVYQQGRGNFGITESDDPVTDPQRVAELLAAHQDVLEATVGQLKAAHEKFFAGRGIDDRVICLTDYFEVPFANYTLSTRDMARFGVCNVTADPDYVEQTLRAARAAGVGGEVFDVIDMRRAPPLPGALGIRHCDAVEQR